MNRNTINQLQWSQESYLKALHFAAHAHRNQLVTGTDLPYLTHVTLVAMEVIAALQSQPTDHGDLAVQCALLHDVIEDTPVTYATVDAEFGRAVADGVLALSKDATLPKKEQMADSLRRILAQPTVIGMVKLADRITNLQAPPAHWSQPKIMQYREEAIEIHAALAGCNPFLAARLQEKIGTYAAFIA